jgi:hypothetical protein
MDRIDHPTAVDIGDGRRGFRSKDTVAGVPGTVATAVHLNAQQEETVGLIEKAGLVPSGDRVDQVLRGIRRGKLNAPAVAGTANALTVTLDPAPLAGEITAGTQLWIKITADNTGPTTLSVNGTVDPLVDFRGAALAQGALTIGQMALVAFDGDVWRLAPQPGATAPILSTFTDTTPGTRTFTPTITGWYELELVSAAGGGGGGVGTGCGGGAGAGARARDFVYLIAGTAYTYTVGLRGTGGSPGFNGSNGGSSSFVGPAGTIAVTGGSAGVGANAGAGGAGGSGGSGSGVSALGSIDPGQSGFQGSPQIGQTGQGGSSPAGGYGAPASFALSGGATAPGGGGAGGTNSNNGSDGASGRLILRALGS